MGCIEDPCCYFAHLDFMDTMGLLHSSNHIVAGVDLFEVAIIQSGDLLFGGLIPIDVGCWPHPSVPSSATDILLISCWRTGRHMLHISWSWHERCWRAFPAWSTLPRHINCRRWCHRRCRWRLLIMWKCLVSYLLIGRTLGVAVNGWNIPCQPIPH